MGVGKTTIGNQLALHHNLKFIDIDNKIEESANESITNIFQKKGEQYYRKLEAEALKLVTKKSIIACGGGLPLYNNNMDFIKESGTSIYLKASEKEIFNRLYKNTEGRPLIEGKSEKELKDYIKETIIKREEFYIKADYIIDTSNLSKEEVLRKIDTLSITL